MFWTIPVFLMTPWAFGLVGLYVLGGFTKYLLVLTLLPVTVQLIALLAVKARHAQESGPMLHVEPRLLPVQRAAVPNH
jgi:hypothetical protein